MWVGARARRLRVGGVTLAAAFIVLAACSDTPVSAPVTGSQLAGTAPLGVGVSATIDADVVRRARDELVKHATLEFHFSGELIADEADKKILQLDRHAYAGWGFAEPSKRTGFGVYGEAPATMPDRPPDEVAQWRVLDGSTFFWRRPCAIGKAAMGFTHYLALYDNAYPPSWGYVGVTNNPSIGEDPFATLELIRFAEGTFTRTDEKALTGENLVGFTGVLQLPRPEDRATADDATAHLVALTLNIRPDGWDRRMPVTVWLDATVGGLRGLSYDIDFSGGLKNDMFFTPSSVTPTLVAPPVVNNLGSFCPPA